MDGIHDLGGMSGFGPVEVERDNRRLTLDVELGRRPPLRRSPQPGE